MADVGGNETATCPRCGAACRRNELRVESPAGGSAALWECPACTRPTELFGVPFEAPVIYSQDASGRLVEFRTPGGSPAVDPEKN